MNPNLMQFVNQPLLLDASEGARMSAMLRSGNVAKREVVSCRSVAENQAKQAKASGGAITAVLPVHGLIDHRDSWMLDLFGGTSVESIREGIDLCLNESRISGILFDFDTPGGSAFGVKEAADYIYSIREQLLMVGISNCVMASAGYYLGAALQRLYASPSSQTGSVGVYMEHYDESKMLEDMGVKATIIRVPEYKAEQHPAEPLSDAAKQNMIVRCQSLYDQFTADVGKYRGISQAAVKAQYGSGRTLSATDALEAGMIDRIATFEDLAADMQSGKVARSVAQSGRMLVPAEVARMRMELMFGGIKMAEPMEDNRSQTVDVDGGASYAYELGSDVGFSHSDETGRVIGRAEFENGEPSYQIRYKAGDGRQVEEWHDESALKVK